MNALRDDKVTPLHFATENNHLEIVKELLANGANVNAGNDKGITPLHCATENGFTDIVKCLESYNLFNKVKSRFLPQSYVDIWVEKGLDINIHINNQTLVSSAILQGHKNVALALINQGAKFCNKAQWKNFADALTSLPFENDILSLLKAVKPQKQNMAEFEGLISYAKKFNYTGVTKYLNETLGQKEKNNLQIEIQQTPSSQYKTKFQHYHCFWLKHTGTQTQKAKALLAEYSGQTEKGSRSSYSSGFIRFFRGGWNNHHGDEVSQFLSKSNQKSEPKQFHHYVKESFKEKKLNPDGDLQTILDVIEFNTRDSEIFCKQF